MVMLAKRRLGLTQFKNRVVFSHLGEMHGKGWDGTKSHGLDLVYAYVQSLKGTPMPKTHAQAVQARKGREEAKNAAVGGDGFLRSYKWRVLRMKVLEARGARCECCGATPADGVKMNVDHIKPRLRHPELALEFSNLQVLCDACNHGKGNWSQRDWREPEKVVVEPVDRMAPRLVKAS